MEEELKYAYRKLNDAFTKLQEGVDVAKDELEKDGVIQRFEFTFELLWKVLKIFLKSKGVETKTPKDSLKESFRLGWLKDEKAFLDMLEDRNKTSHIYDHKAAEEIFRNIKNNYLEAIKGVLENLKRFGSA